MHSTNGWDALDCSHVVDEDALDSGMTTAPYDQNDLRDAVDFVQASFGAVLAWFRHDGTSRARLCLSRSSSSDIRFHDYVLASLETLFEEGEGLIGTPTPTGVLAYAGSESAWDTPRESVRKAAALMLGVPGVYVLYATECCVVEFVCKAGNELLADMDAVATRLMRQYANGVVLADRGERASRKAREQADPEMLCAVAEAYPLSLLECLDSPTPENGKLSTNVSFSEVTEVEAWSVPLTPKPTPPPSPLK
jgi:hypothetical protein